MYTFPHTIDNGYGERLTFLKHVKTETEDYLEVENFVMPANACSFQTSRIAYCKKVKICVLELGKEPQYFTEGETITFEAVRFLKSYRSSL